MFQSAGTQHRKTPLVHDRDMLRSQKRGSFHYQHSLEGILENFQTDLLRCFHPPRMGLNCLLLHHPTQFQDSGPEFFPASKINLVRRVATALISPMSSSGITNLLL